MSDFVYRNVPESFRKGEAKSCWLIGNYMLILAHCKD